MDWTQKAHHADRVLSILHDRASTAQSLVAASWSRSITKYGLDPEHARPPQQLAGAELRVAYERLEPLIMIAQATLDRLFQTVGESGCCVLLTDREGVPLDRRGMVGDDADFRNSGLWTGMVWSEASEGTNGVGTCLAESRALTIHKDQHFLTRNIGLSCTVAPIFDAQGKIAGALDVSTCRSDLTMATVKMIAAAACDAAQKIEARNFRETYRNARVLLCPDNGTGGGGLLAVDREDLVIGANRAARLAFGLTDERLAHRVPADDLLAGGARAHTEDLTTAERGALQRALSRTDGNVSAAARLLGISRATMHRKLARLGLARLH